MGTYLTTSLALQLNLLLISVVLAALLALRPRLLRSWRRSFTKLSHRPYMAAAVIGMLSLSLNLLLAVLRFPLPQIHDEYSYLLASDTFSHFRLSNPPHPLWQHFESFHILSQPTYASKYPPGQGLAMAIGQLLTGYPIVGVWLSLAAACIALYWMLRSWTSAQWALLGALAVSIHAPILRGWGQSYWGGAVAMLGGALVFGGLRRIWRKPRLGDSICLGLGLIVLANTRPAEGLLATIPVFIALSLWFFTADHPWMTKLGQVVAPLFFIGTLGLTGMAAYNHATTGSITLLPYKLHDQTYSASSLVIWKPQPPIPEYNHARMREFYLEFGRERALQLREPLTYFNVLAKKLFLVWDFFPLGLGIGLLAIPWLWRDPWLRLALSTIGITLLVQSQLASSWMFPHYLAPVVGLFYAVNVSGLRRLYVWQRRRRLGQVLVGGLLLSLVLKLGVTVKSWSEPMQSHPRQRIVARLIQQAPEAKHLVIVSYAAEHSPHQEFVYNEADIEAARVVWARDMGAAQNKRLIETFADRKCWRWQVGADDSEGWEPLPSRSGISDGGEG